MLSASRKQELVRLYEELEEKVEPARACEFRMMESFVESQSNGSPFIHRSSLYTNKTSDKGYCEFCLKPKDKWVEGEECVPVDLVL